MNEELQNEYVDVNVHDNYPSSDEHITVPPMKVLPLKKICMTIGQLPTAYLETMTYYEMLLWFIAYLRDNIIPTVNNNGEALEEVQTIVMTLQNYINDFKDSIDQDVEDLEDYVNNYFENLDVQEEINNKLDDMLESGALDSIIQQFLQSNALWTYDTVADMKTATNLVNGSNAKTLGYYAKNDGGEATYIIRTKTNEDVADESTLIALNDTTIIAELVMKDEMSLNAFGCYGDGTHDDTAKFQIALNNHKNIRLLADNQYKVTSSLTVSSNTKVEGSGVASVVLSTIDDGSAIFTSSQSIMHFIIKDFKINADNKNCFGFVFSNPYDNCIFKNIYFDNFTKACIKLGTSEAISQTLLIDNCIAYMSGTATLDTPIFHLIKCYESNILNNKLLNRQTNYNSSPCLLLENVYDNNIQGNSFTCSHDCAIKITGTDCRQNRIISNTYELLDGDYSIKLDGTTSDAILHTLIIEAYTYYSAPSHIYCNNEAQGFFVGMKSTGGRRNMVLNVNDLNVQASTGNCNVTSDGGFLTTKGFGVFGYNDIKKYNIVSNDSANSDYGLDIVNLTEGKKFTIDLHNKYFGSDLNGCKIKLLSPNGTRKYLGIDDNGQITLT